MTTTIRQEKLQCIDLLDLLNAIKRTYDRPKEFDRGAESGIPFPSRVTLKYRLS